MAIKTILLIRSSKRLVVAWGHGLRSACLGALGVCRIRCSSRQSDVFACLLACVTDWCWTRRSALQLVRRKARLLPSHAVVANAR